MKRGSTFTFLAGALAGAGAAAVIGMLLEPSAPGASPVTDTFSAHPTPGDLAPDYPPPRDTPSSPDRSRLQAAPTSEIERSEPTPEWTALVGGVLETEVVRRTGEELPADKKERLLAELARLREASLSLQRTPPEPDDPEELKDRLTQMLALVQADQAFRNELGLGVAEFLQGLSPGAVEEVSPAPAER